MGDFNGKVGEGREEDTVGPYGQGERNDNGERVVNFCKRHNLCVTNTWFQQKKSARHTWIAPDKVTKNQIDYVLVDKRYRNSIQNSKSMPGAECGSDHNPVIVRMKTRLQRVAKPKRTVKWNVSGFKKPGFREDYSRRLDKRLQEEKCDEGRDIDDIWREEIDMEVDIDETWNRLKEDIAIVAEEMCERDIARN